MDCRSSYEMCRYDKHGKASLDTASQIDPSQLFGMLFGSDVFGEYVGELQMAMQLEAGMESASNQEQPVFHSEDEMKAYQRSEQAKVRAKMEKLQKVMVPNPLTRLGFNCERIQS